MNCDQARLLLHPYLDDQLDVVQSLRVVEHLGECPACEESRARIQELSQRVGKSDLRYYAPASLSQRTLTGYHRIWKSLEKNDIAFTFHWGQCQSWGPTPLMARQRLEDVFGQRAIDWLQARNKFLPPKARRTTFASELLADSGLLE